MAADTRRDDWQGTNIVSVRDVHHHCISANGHGRCKLAVTRDLGISRAQTVDFQVACLRISHDNNVPTRLKHQICLIDAAVG